MLTKCHIAHKLARFGIAVHIANGRTEEILLDILKGNEVGTRFVPQKACLWQETVDRPQRRA